MYPHLILFALVHRWGDGPELGAGTVRADHAMEVDWPERTPKAEGQLEAGLHAQTMQDGGARGRQRRVECDALKCWVGVGWGETELGGAGDQSI